MSWRDRLRHWSRFVSAIGVRGEFKGKWLKFTEKVQLPAPELSVFEDGAKNRLTATFGHVLHSKPEGREAKKSKLRRRIIAPVFPHPASFTEFLPVKNSDMRKWSSIVLNFAPAPGNHEGEAPEVRLTLPITSENDFSNFSMPKDSTLNAIVPWFVKDTLVPEESVDARIVQQREMPLDISKQKPIQEFFAASEFNLTEGRLRTPSSTQFSMPKRWLDKEAKGSSTVGVPYMFAGLEIQQTVSLAWKGHFLIYNSIEAGQHGGTRQELSLEAKISTINAEKAAAQREQFLKLLEIAIEGKYWSWNKGSEQVRELPDEEDSFWQRNSSDPNQQQIPMPSQDDLDMPLQNLSEPLEKGSSLIRELSPGPSDAIDMGVEVEEALLTGERLVEDIEEIIGSHSELNAQGYHEDTGTGKEFEETLQTGERLAESIESIEEALGEQSGLSAQGHDTQYTSVGEEFEEALAAGQLLVEETEVALQTREETSTEQHPTSRKCVGQ